MRSVPRHTARYKALTIQDLLDGEVAITAGDATESRGRLPVWTELGRADPNRLLQIFHPAREEIVVDGSEGRSKIGLYDESGLTGVFGSTRCILDISGLSHQVWAPILRNLLSRSVEVRIVYAEPDSYRAHLSPSSSTVFDLSLAFEGLAPMPGFVRLSGPEDETKCLFVATLGFEGNRPESLLTQLDPTPKVFPVVGVPGFQFEYPAYTVSCNRDFLARSGAHSDLRFARASCPFDAYDAIAEIRRDYPDHYMYLAPVGTKPHALGAVLYALKNPRDTELIYDHPRRKPGRTSGVGMIHVYDLSGFSGR